MTVRSAFAKSLYAVATLALMAVAPACSSADTASDAELSENAITADNGTSDDGVAEAVKSGETKSFSGAFSVVIKDIPINMVFVVADINWQVHTARWSAKILNADGYIDVNVPMSISLGRCLGCYQFNANAKDSNGVELANVTFSNFKLTKIDFSGTNAQDATITNVR